MAFEQDLEELDRALGAALEVHLREETVGLRGHTLPAELCARLERRHGVSVVLHSDGAVLRGFGAQPTRAACHLAALLAGPQDQGLAFVLEASCPTRKSAPGTGVDGVSQLSGTSVPCTARTLFPVCQCHSRGWRGPRAGWSVWPRVTGNSRRWCRPFTTPWTLPTAGSTSSG